MLAIMTKNMLLKLLLNGALAELVHAAVAELEMAGYDIGVVGQGLL